MIEGDRLPMSGIFLIDDNKAYCEQIKKSLELKNFHIDFETDAQKGLEMSLKKDWDVILVDMILRHELDGLSILQEIKKKKPDVPVILISGSSVIESVLVSINAGAFDYLEKPIELDRLIVALKNALTLRKIIKHNQILTNHLQQSISKIGLGQTIEQAMGLLSTIQEKPERLLILGEKGTGKELLAKLLHFNGRRKYGPFVVHNCESQEADSAETKTRIRQLFHKAQNGTLFLKEIHRLNPDIQKFLTTLLHQNFFNFKGQQNSDAIDVRIIASSSENLSQLIEQGSFLPELFELLANFTIKIPPLRERVQDIPPLTKHFVAMESQDGGIFIKQITPQVFEILKKQDWPENTAQLKQVSRLMVTHSKDGIIDDRTVNLALKIDQLLRSLKRRDDEQNLTQLFQDILQLERNRTD